MMGILQTAVGLVVSDSVGWCVAACIHNRSTVDTVFAIVMLLSWLVYSAMVIFL
jgi:hypothetical protein